MILPTRSQSLAFKALITTPADHCPLRLENIFLSGKFFRALTITNRSSLMLFMHFIAPSTQHFSLFWILDCARNQNIATPHVRAELSAFRETLFSHDPSRGHQTIFPTRSTAADRHTCEIGRFSARTSSVRRNFCDKIKLPVSREIACSR